ncbi:alpha/beta hydrolase-fold protein [Luteibacter sp. ME-Dv--P-043b]|uniref:alpha/beta hydrolase n=1 Tax=Luteibacter sp. ME-Dv--P-043b TaxID=3040291 RepID=UPI002553126E|nr:alpha/beta hydrolase-fold protein [Luteibacter sp. ME-Dv--P-043b]
MQRMAIALGFTIFAIVAPGTQAAQVAQATQATQVTPHSDGFTLVATASAETRHINVYTPPGYGSSKDRYPVLYMPDGGLQEDFPHVAATLDEGIRAGEIRPVILVGIENTERRRDMTGPTTVAEDKKIAPHVGGSALFRAFIARQLVPEIARRYRVDGHRGIIGESLAGLFSVESLLREPTLFDTVIAISPSLWWNDAALMRDAPALIAAMPAAPRRLFLTSADEDTIGPHVAQLDRLLAAAPPAGLTWTYVPRPDQHHDTIYRASEHYALRWAYPPLKPAAVVPGR